MNQEMEKWKVGGGRARQEGCVRFSVRGEANDGDDGNGKEVAEDEDGFIFHFVSSSGTTSLCHYF